MALALAGCGGGGQAGGPRTVQVGVIPIVDVAPVYLGMQRGFFEEAEVAAQMVLPTWDPRIDKETFDVLVDLGTRDRLLERKPDLAELLG